MLLAGEKRSGAPRTTHDFVENQQHVMSVADLTNAPQIPRRRCHRPRRRTDHRLRDEGHHRLRPDPQQLSLQSISGLPPILLSSLPDPRIAIFETGRDTTRLEKKRLIRRASASITTHGKSAECVAVIALPPRNHPSTSRCASLDLILTRHLQRCFNSRRAVVDEVHTTQARRSRGCEAIRERLRRLVSEKACMGIG